MSRFDLSQVTIKFAAAHGLELTVEDDGKVLVWGSDNDCEWMFSLRMMGESFFYNGNVYLQDSIKEELPYFMKDEKALRNVLKFVATERAKLEQAK